jgi:DNA-binding transcriptional LysR family regulator
MDIRQLRTFVAVARYASITKAAEALHITQPAVSGQIKTLEDELQVRLLSRTTSSVTLTQCGLELLGKAEKAIETFGDFVNAAKSFRGQIEGRLRIGVVMLDPGALRVGLLSQEMVSQHPGLRIDVQVGRTSWLNDAIRSAEIDGAILVCKRRPPGTQILILDKMTFHLVVPASWKDRFKGTSLRQLGQLPWIRMAQRSGHQEMLTEMLETAGLKPIQTVEADHEQLMRALVAAGVGVGLIRTELALEAQAAGEVILFGDHKTTTNLAFAYPEDRGDDPTIRAVLAALRKVWHLQ